MKVKSESEVAQSCPTLSDLMDCSLPGSSVHGFSMQEYWSGWPLPSPDMYVCMYVCMYVYMCVCVCICYVVRIRKRSPE